MNGRDILIYLSIKFKSNWSQIYDSIKNKDPINEEECFNTIKDIKCGCITILDEDYPSHLKSIVEPPFVLFYYGNINLIKDYTKCLTVIGSRKCTAYGKEATERIVSTVAKNLIIVSGMAAGIDSIAHRACINIKGKTVAVLGSGIDYCYPQHNQALYEEIKNSHLLLSEYYGNLEPTKATFPRRNRILAGLSKGCLVTEAKTKSGTSITVSYSLMIGNDVMAVPYLSGRGSLCNRMIQNGCALVETGEDVLYFLGHDDVKFDFPL